MGRAGELPRCDREVLEAGAPEAIKKSRRVQEIYLGTD